MLWMVNISSFSNASFLQSLNTKQFRDWFPQMPCTANGDRQEGYYSDAEECILVSSMLYEQKLPSLHTDCRILLEANLLHLILTFKEPCTKSGQLPPLLQKLCPIPHFSCLYCLTICGMLHTSLYGGRVPLSIVIQELLPLSFFIGSLLCSQL